MKRKVKKEYNKEYKEKMGHVSKSELKRWILRLVGDLEDNNRIHTEMLRACAKEMPMKVKIQYEMNSETIAEVKLNTDKTKEKQEVLNQYFEMFGKESEEKWNTIWETMYHFEQEVNQYLKALDSEIQYLKRRVKSENIASLMKKVNLIKKK